MIVNQGSSAELFGYPIYGGDCPKVIKWIYRQLVKVDNYIVYPFMYRFMPAHKYHIVRTGLEPGYYDIDEVMFRANFALLGRFVEKELGKSDLPEKSEKDISNNAEFPEMKEIDNEASYRGYRLHSGDHAAIDLWIWYKEELPKLEQEYSAYLDGVYGRKTVNTPVDYTGRKFEYGEIENIKTEKLDELIKMRRSLWT